MPGLSRIKRRCFRRNGTLKPAEPIYAFEWRASSTELLVSPDDAKPLQG